MRARPRVEGTREMAMAMWSTRTKLRKLPAMSSMRTAVTPPTDLVDPKRNDMHDHADLERAAVAGARRPQIHGRASVSRPQPAGSPNASEVVGRVHSFCRRAARPQGARTSTQAQVRTRAPTPAA